MTASFDYSSRCSLARFTSSVVGILVRCWFNFSCHCFRFSAASSIFVAISYWCMLSFSSLLIMASLLLITWFRHFTIPMCLLLSALSASSSTSSAFQLCFSKQSSASSGFVHNVVMKNLSSKMKESFTG